MRHQVPNGDLAAVLNFALDALLKQRKQQKFAATNRSTKVEDGPVVQNQHVLTPAPTPTITTPRASLRTRHIPNAVKREVWARDGRRCTFVDAQGNRCTATTLLELHHETPFAEGGLHTAANLHVRCRGHNAYAADHDFGAAFMAQRRNKTDNKRIMSQRTRGLITFR